MSKRYVVTLTAEERGRLEALTRTGKAAARKMIHARILLKADVARPLRVGAVPAGRTSGLPRGWP